MHEDPLFQEFEAEEEAGFEDLEAEADYEAEMYEAAEEYGELEDLGEVGEAEEEAPRPNGRRPGGTVAPPVPGRRPPVRRGGGRLTFPPDVITVRPAFVLTGFCFNESSLMERHIRTIQQIAQQMVTMSRTGPVTARLVGHTDSIGTRPRNEKLGLDRAKEVGKKLRLFTARLLNPLQRGGARLGRLTIVEQSLGETRKVAPNTTEAGRAKNRRVEVFFVRN